MNGWKRDRYFTVRERFKAGERIDALTHAGFGIQSFYEALCAAMRERACESLSLGQAPESELAHTRLK